MYSAIMRHQNITIFHELCNLPKQVKASEKTTISYGYNHHAPLPL